jgi:hypothetical protein
MITIEDDGASMFLDIVEASIREGRRVTVEEAERLLSTRAMSFTLSAYEKLLGLTRDDMVSILVNLGSEQPVEIDPVKLRFEEGFRSCYSLDAVSRLRREVDAALSTDFGVAERKALRYLPAGTVIESTVYLTVDAFNPGMVRSGDVGLSIITGLHDISMDHMAHEFHHAGLMDCLSRRPGIARLAVGADAPEEVAAQLVCHLVSEGLANHYCTPNMVRVGEHKSTEANEKILGYERNQNAMIEEAWSLIRDCLDGEKPLEEYKERLTDILIDRESILPKVHFIGEKIISVLEEDPEIRFKDIVELCIHPENLLFLYAGPAARLSLPQLPNEYALKLQQIMAEM